MGQISSLHDCHDVRLEGSTLHARTPHKEKRRGGSIRVTKLADLDKVTEMFTHWIPASFPLDQVIGNHEGHLVWGLKNFSRSAQNIALSGTVLSADLRSLDGSISHSSLDLDFLIFGEDGRLIARQVPALISVPKEHNEKIASHIGQALAKSPNMSLSAINHPDGKTTFVLGNPIGPHSVVGDKEGVYLAQVANAGDEGKLGYLSAEFSTTSDPTAFFTTTSGEAKASVFHVAHEMGHPIQTFEVDLISAKTSFFINTVRNGKKAQAVGAGIDARINLIDMKASVFDLNIGYGVKTDFGIQDHSLSVHFLGEGFTIGRKISISAWGGSSFGIDLGRLFG